MFKASPFKLNTFATCPRLYKFIYLDRLSKDFQKPKPYLTMGAHVHNALKDFYEQVEGEDRNFVRLEKILRHRWTENRKGFKDKKDEATWGVKALHMLRLFAHRMDLTINPVLLEDYYDTAVDAELTVLGRIDRADQLADGSLQVIDYKTGKYDPDDVSDLQLLLYSIIVSARLRRPVTKASYLYLQTWQWHTVEVDQESAETALATVHEKVSAIQQEHDFLPTPNKNCRHCDFAEICPQQSATIR